MANNRRSATKFVVVGWKRSTVFVSVSLVPVVDELSLLVQERRFFRRTIKTTRPLIPIMNRAATRTTLRVNHEYSRRLFDENREAKENDR